MNCHDCAHCVLRDSGYSVWTVLNTDIECSLCLNKNLPLEMPVSDDKLIDSNECAAFLEGEPTHFDVDNEIV